MKINQLHSYFYTLYYLVEKAASNFEYLKRHLDIHRPHQLPYTRTIKGDFVKASELIISDIKRRKGGERALFILDQYGYDAVPMATLRRIFNQVDKAEVLLTFNVDSLITYLTDIPLFRQMLEKMGLERYVDWSLLSDVAKAATPNWKAIIQKMLARGIIEQSGAQFGTIFFIRPEGATPWTYWLVHLSGVFKARNVMMNIHWKHANDFGHALDPDIFDLIYGASKDPEATRQQLLSYGNEFTFDAEAKKQCQNGLAEKLPRLLFDQGQPTSVQNLLNDLGNFTPATFEILSQSLDLPIATKDIEAVGKDGSRRRKGSSIQLTDTIVPATQRPIFFSPS